MPLGHPGVPPWPVDLARHREYRAGMSPSRSLSAIHHLHCGDSPLLVSVPHAGVGLPEPIRSTLAPGAGEGVPGDTDHFVDRLYEFVPAIGASLLVARMSRWVVDLNRPADDQPLYPGQAGTGLVPRTRFDGSPIWAIEPDAEAVRSRVQHYWRPYHDALRAELDRKISLHGFAILWDAHSIRSQVPRLFDGTLPDLNLGTYSGASCDPGLRAMVGAHLSSLGQWSHVVDGRFRGGHITRHYGRPAMAVHALQLELAQSTYMDEAAAVPTWSPSRAAPLARALRDVLEEVGQWHPA